MWPPGSADTVCPRPPVMTRVQHYVSRMKKRQRWGVQMMRACNLDLWPWNWCAMSHVSCSTLLPILVIRLFVSDLWAIGRCVRRSLDSGRGEASSLSIDRPAANCCCLDGRNRQFVDKILDLESDFRLMGSAAMLRSLIRICVRVWCKLIRKWPRNTPSNNQR